MGSVYAPVEELQVLVSAFGRGHCSYLICTALFNSLIRVFQPPFSQYRNNMVATSCSPFFCTAVSICFATPVGHLSDLFGLSGALVVSKVERSLIISDAD